MLIDRFKRLKLIAVVLANQLTCVISVDSIKGRSSIGEEIRRLTNLIIDLMNIQLTLIGIVLIHSLESA